MANNNSQSLILYEQRLYYKYSFFNDVDNKIDFWSQQKYYGILDNKSIPVYLNKQNLKSISSQGVNNLVKKQSLLNVASDCFQEMLTEFKSADTAFIINKSIYNPLNVKKSTLIFEDEYTNYIRQFLDIWYEENRNTIDNIVDNFDHFLKLFINTFGLLTKPIITQSAYLMSNLASPLITGLSFEVSNEKHDQDPKKISGYIRDQNFQFVYNTAAKYSFMIDKNAPWRFVFNMTSQYASDKLNGYGVDGLDNFFSKLYVYPHLTEYTTIKNELIKFYTSKVNKKPQLQKSSYCHATKGLNFETITKDTNTEKTNFFWIQLYYFIRCKEENIGMTQVQFEYDLKKIFMLYNSFGETAALEWILNKTKKFVDGGTNPSYTQYAAVSKNKSQNLTLYTFNF